MAPISIRHEAFFYSNKGFLQWLASFLAQSLLSSYGLSLVLRPFQTISSASLDQDKTGRIYLHRNGIFPIHRLSLVESQVYSGMPRHEGETLSEDPRPPFRLCLEAELDNDAS